MPDLMILEKLVKKIQEMNRRPDFGNILSICRREQPSRPTLFEFIINDNYMSRISGMPIPPQDDALGWCRFLVQGFKNVGYDYAVVGGWHLRTLVFPTADIDKKVSKSLNAGAIITDRKSFDSYNWPDPQAGDYAPLQKIAPKLPDGMKLIVSGYEGVLETVINIVGFENLCIMLFEDPELAGEIFFNVGSRIMQYYEICLQYDSVGALIVNDDWGFKTQTMLSPDSLRSLVFPWYKKIVEMCHQAGKPVILHSCGNLDKVLTDITHDLKFDCKHSFEDNIIPVEEAYTCWGDTIAIMGGIDINFMVKKTTADIRKRVTNLLRISADKGGLAIGSGNSIADYIPAKNFCAMIDTVINYK